LLRLAKRILIVEDDKAIRDMMKSVLEVEGYTVLAASNGKMGIEALKGQESPNVILLDMMMPVMNGWDFLDFLRSNSLTRQIPVVIVSAYGEIARSVKPQGFVPKPIQLKALLDAIEKCAA
jgi:CheY-like chemotaxis protein